MEKSPLAFEVFLDRHGHFFRTRTRHNVAVARADTCADWRKPRIRTFESMAAVVEGGCPQQFQHFISCSPMGPRAGGGADRPGRGSSSGRQADERADHRRETAAFHKQGGDRSVGVARQWTGQGRQLSRSRGVRGADRWLSATRRSMRGSICRSAGSRTRRAASWAGFPRPRARRCRRANSRSTSCARRRARGIRFAWVGVDGGYGKEPDFLRRLDDENETFVADVHHLTNTSGQKEPGLRISRLQAGPRASVEEAETRHGVHHHVKKLAEGIRPRTGRAASCATARADSCGLTSRPAGSGSGTARKSERDAHGI